MIESLKELGQLIRKRRQAMGLTLDALAAATGISKPYLSNIETARAPGPASDEKLTALEKALDLPAGQLVEQGAWLRTPASVRALFRQKSISDVGSLPRRPDGTVNLDALLPPATKPPQESHEFPPKLRDVVTYPVRSLPLINRVAAGQPAEFTDLDYPVGIADAYLPMPELPADSLGGELTQPYFALRVVGDSMEPEYQEGDLLILGGGPVGEGQDCLIRLDEAENFATTFKRVYFGKAGEGESGGGEVIRLVALNSRYPERTVLRERVTGIFPVLWKMTPVPHFGG